MMGEWIEWIGGTNPAPGKWVEVRSRGGSEIVSGSGNFHWTHDGSSLDIVAYRVWVEADRG